MFACDGGKFLSEEREAAKIHSPSSLMFSSQVGRRQKGILGVSLITFGKIVTIFHAKTKEFCVISIQYRKYISCVLSTEGDGKLQKSYSLGVVKLLVSHTQTISRTS